MHKVIRKRVRHNRDGVNIAADIDAVIAINTGANPARSHASARSSHVVAQGASRRAATPEAPPPDPTEPVKEKPHDR